MKYDIFISYKRKSLATANNLYYRLTTRGYSTFFDLEEMGRDNFNVQLLNYIENAQDVFVILEEGSLDACKNEDWEQDWFCHEIAFALEKKKNIIPILLGGYQMPSEEFFPKKLKELCLKNSPEFNFSFFEAYLDKLIEKEYLLSKPDIKEKNTSVFKFYSNENCQVFKEGKLVCSLEGLSEEPYYLPVPRKGEYRFKVINNASGEAKVLNEVIDAIEEKNVEVHWNSKQKVTNLFKGKRKGCSIVISIAFLLSIVFIPLSQLIVFNSGKDSTPTATPPSIDSIYTVCQSVDLGLTSGTLWGDRNVGANSPAEFGNLYAWGEMKPKDEYTETTYGEPPSRIIKNAKHDVAMAELGEGWSMPSEEQFKELLSECKWIWKTESGHNGFEIVGPNGNKIFLPAAGWSHGNEAEYENRYGYYWTSERSLEGKGGLPTFARSLLFPKNGKGIVGNGYLYYGRSVRAVYVNETVAE